MEFIKTELSRFKCRDVNPGKKWRGAGLIFASWAIPAFMFVVLVSFLETSRDVSYYQDAISQGVGPKLWNVMGAFGFALFFVSLVFPKIRCFAIAAKQVLLNVFAIGALTFGLLFGQFICLIPELDKYFDGWQFYFFGPVIVVLLVAVALLNLATWYMSYLIQWRGRFRVKISQMSVVTRTVFGTAFALLPLWLLWVEK